MVEVRNNGSLPALVQGYWLYPGETRSVPAKLAQRLLDTNPALALYGAVQPPQQAATEPQVAAVDSAPEDSGPDDQPVEADTESQVEPEDQPLPQDQAEAVSSAKQRARRK